nr:MAG TPA: hypothetical protein [Caudoviricetes sp.]DAY81173.1 MAG TPA: hypothetical protein [Caudoviricetes sp.]
MCGRCVSSRLCTLREVQTFYSLEDVYDLDEVLMLQNYHDWLATRKDD